MPPPALPDKYGPPPSPRSASPSKTAFPRFGGQTSCPGCHKAVSLMERGVVPGPQGSKWHASCLVCGGKKEVTRAVLLGRVRDDTKKPEPGCGKKLDSAAKIDGEGGVWCRECLVSINRITTEALLIRLRSYLWASEARHRPHPPSRLQFLQFVFLGRLILKRRVRRCLPVSSRVLGGMTQF